MPNIIEILAQKHKQTTAKIAKQYHVGQALSGLEGAREFDDLQKSAILEIAGTRGFQVIMDYEAKIISKCEGLLAIEGLPEADLKKVQVEYSLAKARHSFFSNLADPNKK